MGKVITISNQKGGVGKTTSATALTAALTKFGYKALLIDVDPQCNASESFTRGNVEKTLYDVFNDPKEIEPESVIESTSNGYLIKCHYRLHEASVIYTGLGKDRMLAKFVNRIKNDFDYIIIDTPPTLGLLLINALTAADSVIIPVGADEYSIKGLDQLLKTIYEVIENTNEDLEIDGVFVSNVTANRKIVKKAIKELPAQLDMVDLKMFDTFIRNTTVTNEAQVSKESIISFAPESNTTKDYISLMKEIIAK